MPIWIFMVIMCLLIPIIMVLFGRCFMIKAPKEINYVFGYRTSMSMKNRDTWEFAHKLLGKIWFFVGIVLLPLSVIPMLFVIGCSEDSVGTVGTAVMMVDMVLMIITIIPVEIKLNKVFDKQGNRK